MTPPPPDDSPTIGLDATIGATAGFDADATIAGDVRPGSPPGTPGPLQPNTPFGSRYRILRELGAGGMGVVYQAWDEELGVAVALKIIRPEVTSDPYLARDVERRFKRELLLARQVTHSNVVRIYDLGEIDGIKYITMSYVDGVDLASVIKREGRLPVPRALRILRGIVSGMRAAHEAGVVHRDLKPANVMIDTQDEARIMDFGIARSTTRPADGAAGADGAAQLFELRQQAALLTAQTMQGGVVGTVEYMAPEQARGEPVDQRADIYAIGLIVYDMLGGAGRAARSESALVELTARMQQPPAPIRTINPDVPEPLERLIARCLEPDPNARYASTKDLEADLERLDDEGHLLPVLRRVSTRQMVGAAVLTLALLAGTWWAARPPPAEVQPPPTSVLIADFENQAGDPVFEGALEQALAIAMEGAPFISAYQRNTARQIAERRLKRGTRLDLETARLVANSEGVKVVLAGSIAAQGGGYRLRLQALDVEGNQLAERTQTAASKAQVLEAVGKLAADIREDLGDTSSVASRRADAETFTSTSLDAVQAFARGVELNRSGKPREALDALHEAIRADDGFGMAYVHIGSIYTNLKMDDQAKVYYDQAFKHLDRMTEREKYRSLGVYYFDARNYKEAIKNYEKLVELYPADNTGYANLALAYLYDRRIPQAVEMGRKATEIYPRNILQRTNYATYSMYSGDFKTAKAEAEKVLKDNPAYEWAGLTFALSTLAEGDEAGARAAFERLSRTSALGASLANMGLADLELFLGRPSAALKILQQGIAADEREKDSSNLALKLIATAEAYVLLGNRAAALRPAERAASLYQHEAVLVPAADTLAQLGRDDRARQLGTKLQQMIPVHLRSYGRVAAGVVALRSSRIPDAVSELQAARESHDSWYAQLMLGHAYYAAGQFREAMAQWEECIQRRGEATDVFFADTSSMRYLPPVYYWLGRAKEEVSGRAAAADDYRKYLELRSGAERDPFAADAEQRLSR